MKIERSAKENKQIQDLNTKKKNRTNERHTNRAKGGMRRKIYMINLHENKKKSINSSSTVHLHKRIIEATWKLIKLTF